MESRTGTLLLHHVGILCIWQLRGLYELVDVEEDSADVKYIECVP